MRPTALVFPPIQGLPKARTPQTLHPKGAKSTCGTHLARDITVVLVDFAIFGLMSHTELLVLPLKK